MCSFIRCFLENVLLIKFPVAPLSSSAVATAFCSLPFKVTLNSIDGWFFPACASLICVSDKSDSLFKSSYLFTCTTCSRFWERIWFRHAIAASTRRLQNPLVLPPEWCLSRLKPFHSNLPPSLHPGYPGLALRGSSLAHYFPWVGIDSHIDLAVE